MKKQIRCAIYTRKSTEEGLEQDFNSLDAQREACESYIKSQKHEGWVLSKNRYDDEVIQVEQWIDLHLSSYFKI